jgi:hypothetical protein
LFELFLLAFVDVRPLAFGESIYEERPGPAPEENDRTVTFGSSLSGPRDPLLDDFAAKIGIDQSSFGPSNSFTKGSIRNSFFAS